MERRPLDEYTNGALRRRSAVPSPQEAANIEQEALAQLWEDWYRAYNWYLVRQMQWFEELEEARALTEAQAPEEEGRRSME